MRHHAILRLLALCLTLVLIAAAQSGAALACSGGGPPPVVLRERVLDADAIVFGHVLYTDVTGANFVLRVRRYLNGASGPRDIVVQGQTPESIVYDRERPPSIRCFYTPAAQVAAGDEIVVFLSRMRSGAYTPAPHIFTDNQIARYPTGESVVRVNFTLDDQQPGSLYTMTRRELSELVQAVTGLPARAPDESPEPLPSPLLVTTDDGTRHLVPIDGGRTVRVNGADFSRLHRHNPSCWTPGCTAWTRGGDFSVTIGGSEVDAAANPVSTWPAEFTAITFAPAGDVYAAWRVQPHETTLVAAMLPGVGTMSQYDRGTPHPQPVSTVVRYSGSVAEWSALGAWLPDGRTLAYVDADGLYLWDAFTPGAQPVLTPHLGVTAVHGVSPSGRFLSATIDGDRAHLDLSTGAVLPDGALGVDERVLVAYGQNPRLIYTMAGREEAIGAPAGQGQLREAQWFGRWGFAAVFCASDARESCIVNDISVIDEWMSNKVVPYFGYAFDYNEDTGSLVTARLDRTLFVRYGTAGTQREIDLSGVLDSDIAAVEWLPSLFYDLDEG